MRICITSLHDNHGTETTNIISYCRQSISQREIAKTLGINRKTVKKYIDEYKGEKERSYLEQTGVINAPPLLGVGCACVRVILKLCFKSIAIIITLSY